MSIDLKRNRRWQLGNIPTTQNLNTPSGLAGNMFTINLIREKSQQRKIHPKVRNLALFILTDYGIKSHDYINEARAIGKFVQKNCEYVRDIKDVEQIHDPVTLIDQIQRYGVTRGDCDDCTILICSLLLSIGHQPYACCVRYKSDRGNFNHIYPVVYEKGLNHKKPIRLPIDAIVKRKPIGYEVRSKSKEEFRI